MADKRIKITGEEREKIEQKSPSRSLPLNPLQRGWSSEQIRSQLSRFVTDKENSVLALLEDKFNIIDSVIEALETDLKDYTYSKEQIDNKDFVILQEAKDYTYEQNTIDNKDANTLQEAKNYIDNKAGVYDNDLFKVLADALNLDGDISANN